MGIEEFWKSLLHSDYHLGFFQGTEMPYATVECPAEAVKSVSWTADHRLWESKSGEEESGKRYQGCSDGLQKVRKIGQSMGQRPRWWT